VSPVIAVRKLLVFIIKMKVLLPLLLCLSLPLLSAGSGEAEAGGSHHHPQHQDKRHDKSISQHPSSENSLSELGHYAGQAHHGDTPEYHVFHVEFERVEIPFIIALWIFVSSLAKIGFHMTPKLHHIFPESCLLIVVGIIIGFLLFLTSEHPPSTLTPNIFFLFMLPPIILDAGYFMPNRLFFDHLGTILLMAVVGTIFNVITIGLALWGCGQAGIYGEHDTPGLLETFLFSSLISAVDPVAVLAVFEEIQVDEVLYIVVFGESLLNDAVTVVLYNMFESYVEIEEENITVSHIGKGFASFIVVAGGGTIIGIIWGYVTGFVTRFTNHAPILEPMFVFTMAYLSYLCAEIFHMSGILAITFCGITMKNYVERNVSNKSQTTIKYAMKMLSSSSETIIFMFLGVATIHDEHVWNWWFTILTIVFCTVFRCIGVVILVGIANRYRLHKLGAVDQFVMMYGGLRGAVAFALVLLIDAHVVPHAHMFVTTTIAVVYWTVFVQGITIKPLVKFLNVKTMSEKEPSMNERISGRFIDHIMAGMEGILGEFGHLHLRDMYKHIDNKYIKPCLLRENHVKDPKIIETYHHITNQEVEEMMKNNPQSFSELKINLKESKSISTIFNSSQTNLAHVENLDMKEINFNQSRKDLTEAKIHHMLTEVMARPQLRQRKYSRHQLEDDESKINHKMHLQVRRMMSEKRQKKKVIRTLTGEPVIQVEVDSSEEGRITGTEKQLQDARVHQMLSEDVEAAPPPYSAYSPAEGKGNALSPNSLSVPEVQSPRQQKKKSEIRTLLDATTTVADNQKPQWMIFQCHGAGAGGVDNPAYDDEEHRHDGAVELPWKREDQEVQVTTMGEQQIPAWIKNKDYEHSNYSSPANTLLGLPRDEKKRSAIIGYFQKRDSLTFLGDFENDGKSGSRRNSKEGDFLSVLANPVNIRKSSAPPLNRQISLSSMRPFTDDDDDAAGPGRRSPSQLTPIIERKNRDTILSFEDELFRRK